MMHKFPSLHVMTDFSQHYGILMFTARTGDFLPLIGGVRYMANSVPSISLTATRMNLTLKVIEAMYASSFDDSTQH